MKEWVSGLTAAVPWFGFEIPYSNERANCQLAYMAKLLLALIAAALALLIAAFVFAAF